MKPKQDTLIVTAGRHPDAHFGAVNPPVYHASTILFPTVEAMKTRNQPYTYGRRGTPTLAALEEAIAAIEGGARTVLTPSGLSAVSTALLAFLKAGDHLLMTDNVYGPSRHFCDTILKRNGIEVEYYDPEIGAGIAKHMKPNTRVIFAESPGSITFEVQDIPALAKAAHAGDAKLIVDNTWASPLYFKPFEHGADVSVQAITKYLCGHSDVMMGAITATEEAGKTVLATHGSLGMTVAPDDVYLVLRGMRTLSVRLERHMKTGIELARWFADRPEVSRVLHPALPTDPGHELWKRDFTGASGLFSIVLKPCPDAAISAMLDHLEYFGMGWSWGGYESLIVPQDLHGIRSSTPAAFEGPIVRIHAGLEDPRDLIADLEAGFARFNAALG
ncbi:cystathionine beta-lyase [Parvibaculum sp.]|uniref:cystathionine beta-lyase n=1 Tax=Parvibaculum sp. TaxID=2024848 RepID=UPI00320C3C48